MLTYKDVKDLFESARDKSKGKPYGNNIRIVKCGDDYGIQHHSTIIVRITPDNRYILNNGGWYSVTTKKHLNTFSPARIYQAKGQWFFASGFGDRAYFNGAIVNSDGYVLTMPNAELRLCN